MINKNDKIYGLLITMMKQTITLLCLFMLCKAQSASIQNDIDSLIHRINPRVNLGILVVDLTSGETLYRRNAENLFIPASNMKLFSEAAALMVLGPDYQFKNQLSISPGAIQKGVLHGDLYLQLSGDPSFSRENLKKLLSSLEEWNIKTIQGNVYLDSRLAQIDPYPPGWLSTDLSYSYGAPNAPLVIDANRLTVTANPGAKPGSPALIEVNEGNGVLTLTNQVNTKANSLGCSVGFYLDEYNHLTARGCIGIGQWAVQQRLAIKNPLAYAQNVIKQALANEHIQLNGYIQLGRTPMSAVLISTQYSKPLSELMADTLKPSDNLYADSLYLHAAAALKGSPVNWKEAEPIIKNFLQTQTGINFKNAVFTDGSGLSRYSLVTPEQTLSLLKFLYQRFPLSYEYISALPVSGRDGTLQKRFHVPREQGFIRAKTGTMTGINSLSGYLYTANGHTLAFAMYINRKPGSSAGPGRPVLDALGTYFLQLNPVSHQLIHILSAHERLNFQLNPAQAARQKIHQAKWRHLEFELRKALSGQPVTIVYREHELIIQDNQLDAEKVWSSLQPLIKHHPFSVMLSSKILPITHLGKPTFLWVQAPDTSPIQRTWIIKESVMEV
jgi:D-alanyl-D-alanine carboxypeptidase/D-alanyl-D-alanine-endopeptidase (penicillin-binding protein 4)